MLIKSPIEWVSIKGFKSIKLLDRFKVHRLNVLIGANGSGKSNFVSYFRMLHEMMGMRLQNWVSHQGSADRIVSFGIKETNRIESFIEFGLNGYKFELEATVDGGFSFVREDLFFDGPLYGEQWTGLGSGHRESKLQEAFNRKKNFREKNPREEKPKVEEYCYGSISNWKVFHFHDTSDTAGVKRLGSVDDNLYLRADGSNLAAFLYKLSIESSELYEKIRDVVRLSIPFFDDFELRPQSLKTGEEQIKLLWKQKGSDYPFWPSQLSDGSIRFICLVTALLQPDPPSTIIIDEPELGLHPSTISILGALLKKASQRMQVIVSTQSAALVNEFNIEDLIIVEREDGESIFHRYQEGEFEDWLEEYSLGEVWEKNIIGGRA